MLLLLVRLVELLIHIMTLKDKQCCSDIVYISTGAPNSAKLRGGGDCRGTAKIRQRGVAIIFLLFTR